MKKISYILFTALLLLLNSCGIYNFTGAGPINAKTFQVNYFQNVSELVEPGIDRDFTLRLQDLIQNQTNLSLTPTDGDLVYEGEITDYRISPMTATADLTAAQNRLTISVNLRFSNKNKPQENFEKRFSFFYDYPGDQQLTGAQLRSALDVIFERITQDMFNDTLAKW
ncbi:LptE family protein [Flavobacterium luminosum]|uniref:LPS assembly lipoprotein LptE n=1 Tax=Flavobacterium luminosum TaxID=2949086 RepID=A0ABT0TKC8_9FLAO|nr:LptE family protein [Flavobacterium sp. HXWNR70]MCL9807954.1 LPS assembly lipoprotein LptE [Flavobacterium sp. HXWNR70]